MLVWLLKLASVIVQKGTSTERCKYPNLGLDEAFWGRDGEKFDVYLTVRNCLQGTRPAHWAALEH